MHLVFTILENYLKENPSERPIKHSIPMHPAQPNPQHQASYAAEPHFAYQEPQVFQMVIQSMPSPGSRNAPYSNSSFRPPSPGGALYQQHNFAVPQQPRQRRKRKAAEPCKANQQPQASQMVVKSMPSSGSRNASYSNLSFHPPSPGGALYQQHNFAMPQQPQQARQKRQKRKAAEPCKVYQEPQVSQMVIQSMPSPGTTNAHYSNPPNSPFHPPSSGEALYQQLNTVFAQQPPQVQQQSLKRTAAEPCFAYQQPQASQMAVQSMPGQGSRNAHYSNPPNSPFHLPSLGGPPSQQQNTALPQQPPQFQQPRLQRTAAESCFAYQQPQVNQMAVQSMPGQGSRNAHYSNPPNSLFHPPSPGGPPSQQQITALPQQPPQVQQQSLQRTAAEPCFAYQQPQANQKAVQSMPGQGSRNAHYSNPPNSPFHRPSPGGPPSQQQNTALPQQLPQVPQQTLQRTVSIQNQVNLPLGLPAGFTGDHQFLSPQPYPENHNHPDFTYNVTRNHGNDGNSVTPKYVHQEICAMVGARTL